MNNLKNILVVTLGTREIQHFKSNGNSAFYVDSEKKAIINAKTNEKCFEVFQNVIFQDYYCHTWSRIAGKFILENINYFQENIEFPLINNAFNAIIGKNEIHEIYIVYTDQKDLNLNNSAEFKNFNRDTVYYKEILKILLKSKYPQLNKTTFCEIAIENKVTDIDFQYIEFGKKCKTLFEEKENIKQVFLLPQGGIDQINHSLTLQLIQEFGNKVNLWQQAETYKPAELKFARIFLNDLFKHQIISLINEGNYRGAIRIAKDNICEVNNNIQQKQHLVNLLRFGELRIEGLFNEICSFSKNGFVNNEIPEIIDIYKRKLFSIIKSKKSNKENMVFFINEYFEISYFFYVKENWTKFTLAFQIFIENFLRLFISSYTNHDLYMNFYVNSKETCETISANTEILKILKEKFNKEFISELTVPVLFSYCLFLSKSDKKASEIISLLAICYSVYKDKKYNIDALRNEIAHKGKGVKESQLKLFIEENVMGKLRELLSLEKESNFITLNKHFTSYLQQSF